MSQLVRATLPADSLPGESVVALYFSDQRPLAGPAGLLDWRLDGALTRQLVSGIVQGRAGEHIMISNNGKLKADWVLFVGGGKWHGLSAETYTSLVRHMLKVASQAGFRRISLPLAVHESLSENALQMQFEQSLKPLDRAFESCSYSYETLKPNLAKGSL